jgi:hypothetical protein
MLNFLDTFSVGVTKTLKKKQKEKAIQTTTEIHSWASQFCLDRNLYGTPLEACPTKHNPELGHCNTHTKFI